MQQGLQVIPYIKRARLYAHFTQEEAAKAARVNQSTYRGWESGLIEPSKKALATLAKIFCVSVKHLTGDIDGLGDPKGEGADEAFIFFGHVAFHFVGGSKPLVLPISWDTYHGTFRRLKTNRGFFLVTSLDNRTVLIRKNAIASVYFSSDETDTIGPDDTLYETLVGVYPDEAFWGLVESFRNGDIDDLCPPDKARELKELLSTSEDAFFSRDMFIGLDPEPRKRLYEHAQAVSERFLQLASEMEWQVGGIKQSEQLDEDTNLTSPLRSFEGMDHEAADIYTPLAFTFEEQFRTVFINHAALDYVSVPTHKFLKQHFDQLEELQG